MRKCLDQSGGMRGLRVNGLLRTIGCYAVLGALVSCGESSEEATAPSIDPADLPGSIFDLASPLEVSVEIAEADWETLRVDGRAMAAILNPTESGFEYQRFMAQVTVAGNVFENVEIRKKGFIGSLSTLRPSLKMDFGPRVAVDQEGARRLTLNNDLQDPSHLRQCLSFELFNRVDIPAPRCAYAHVTVNGNDMGLYTSLEPIRKRMLSRFFDDATGHLYEGTLADLTDETVDDIEAKRPDPEDNRDDLAELVSALQAPDSEAVERLSAIVDLERFRTFWALETLLGHWDGYSGNANNYYLYADPATGKFVFLPWGTDQVFVGRPGFNDDPYEPTGYAHGALARRLYDLPEQRQAFKERLAELIEELWQPEALEQSAQALLATVGEQDQTAVEEVLEHLRTHGGSVAAALLNELPEVPVRAEPETDECAELVSDIEGSFSMDYSSAGAGAGFFDLSTSVNEQEIEASLQGVVVSNGGDQESSLVLGLGNIEQLSSTIGFILPRAYFSPGVKPFHSFESFGFLNILDPETGEEVGVGLIGDGDINFEVAGSDSGDLLKATFRATLYQSQCAKF